MAFFYQSDFRIADHYRRTVTDSPLPDEVNLSLTRRSVSDMKWTTVMTIPRCLGAQDISSPDWPGQGFCACNEPAH